MFVNGSGWNEQSL